MTNALFCFAFFLHVFIFIINAEEVYVGVNGTLASNCGSFENPCASLSFGLGKICANVSDSSKVLILLPGEYSVDGHLKGCSNLLFM